MDQNATVAAEPPRAGSEILEVDVAIVGGGPTGLMLAAELALRGVRFVLLERRSSPDRLSRANDIHGRTLEVLDQHGLAGAALASGLPVLRSIIMVDRQPVADIPLDNLGTRFPPYLGLRECDLEQLVEQRVRDLGGDVRRGHDVVAVEQNDSGVLISVRTRSGLEDVRAGWLVGCGGLHGPVRAAMRASLDGFDYRGSWCIVDARFDGWPWPDDHSVVFVEGLAVMPSPEGWKRCAFWHQPGREDDDAAGLQRVLDRIVGVGRVADTREHFVTTYHLGLAERFRAGRLLIAGDAAHVASPSGGTGLNSGVQDAHNLGWKLALAVRGEAAPDLLDSYEAERRATDEANIRRSDALEARVEADPAALADVARQFAVETADPAAVRAAVFAARVESRYPDSPIAAGETPRFGPAPGQRVPDAGPLVDLVGNSVRLQRPPTHRPSRGAGTRRPPRRGFIAAGGSGARPARGSVCGPSRGGRTGSAVTGDGGRDRAPRRPGASRPRAARCRRGHAVRHPARRPRGVSRPAGRRRPYGVPRARVRARRARGHQSGTGSGG